MPKLPIYMDNHATTRVDPRVVEAMRPYWTEIYGNAGSTSHIFGHDAQAAVERARIDIAQSIGGSEREIVFTSGSTESNNLAIRGIADRQRRRGNHLVSVTTEHKSVLEPLEKLGRRGFEISLLTPEQSDSARMGWLDPQRVADAIRDETCLVSIMLANNEIGVIQPLAEMGRICKERGVPLHCDATQAVGKIPVDVSALDIDLMSFTAHKIYGPKGIGALYVRRRGRAVRLQPLIDGGGQEWGFRSGTLNVPGIVGFAAALQICLAEIDNEQPRLAHLRNHLYSGLRDSIDDLTLNGPALEIPGLRLAGNLNVSFALVDGEALMMSMRDVAVSSGSACTSANPEPSHVLRALGLSDDLTRASLRFGLGRFNTLDEVDFAVESTAAAVRRLRTMSSMS